MSAEARQVFLSLGSNVGDRRANLRSALGRLRDRVSVGAISSLYETDPVGVTDQPAFYNIVVGGATTLAPRDLLRAVKEIEHDVGRRPTYRWGPRVVDIDILVLGELAVDEPELTIPHREVANRAFVLVPLAEIAPELHIPGFGRVTDVRDRLDISGVRVLGALDSQ
jgi:2-amino-4-hydroxy-6-hydroxymethyldihydropteridine diphosphokinase